MSHELCWLLQRGVQHPMAHGDHQQLLLLEHHLATLRHELHAVAARHLAAPQEGARRASAQALQQLLQQCRGLNILTWPGDRLEKRRQAF